MCVCHPLLLRVLRVLHFDKAGDWSRFAYPVQGSYGISVDEWSDQPLVPATLELLPTL